MSLSIIILAAGNGKRMQSSIPKVLHTLGGMPMLEHVVKAASSLDPTAIYVIFGKNGDCIQKQLSHLNVTWIPQQEPKGTAHAVLQALPHIPDDHQVLILYGDVPLIKSSTLKQLIASTGQNQLGILVAKFDNPSGFGRIIRNEYNDIVAILEHKDATEEHLSINEINTGILTASSILFKEWLPFIQNENAQGEYYLTDVVSLSSQQQIEIISILAPCAEEVTGVNDRQELIYLERYYQKQKARALLLDGVTIMDPARFDTRGELKAGKDVLIDIDVVFEGRVTIEEGSRIGAFCVLKNVEIGKNVIIHPHSIIEDATIADHCIVGPFARIRPMTALAEGVHVGNFVELKKTTIDQFSKVNHLTYLGDATVGKNVNVGAGTITCNYDGVNKFPTIIADEAFIGSGTELVAPIKIGRKAYVGAGSTLTKDAPEEELTLARSKQVTVKGWKKNK